MPPDDRPAQPDDLAAELEDHAAQPDDLAARAHDLAAGTGHPAKRPAWPRSDPQRVAEGRGRPSPQTGHRAGEPGHAPAGPTVPSPHRRAPARFSWLGVALLGGAAVIALTITVGIFLPALGEMGAAAARDPANLPDRISVCGRDWTRDALSRTFTRDEIEARTEAEPLLVSTGPSATCPPEVESAGEDGGIATVVYVKTGDDAFVPYELVGGP